MDKLSDQWQKYILDRICIDENLCWNWTLSLHRDGYVKINKDGFWQGHRLSYAAFNPGYDKTLLVLHKCHNRKCVNPEHLYQGTHKDNARDTMEAGRGKKQFESLDKHWNFKYSCGFIELVKHLLENYRNCEISRTLKIPAPTVSGIKNSNKGRYKS